MKEKPELSQCKKCLTMKSFTGDFCARCETSPQPEECPTGKGVTISNDNFHQLQSNIPKDAFLESEEWEKILTVELDLFVRQQIYDEYPIWADYLNLVKKTVRDEIRKAEERTLKEVFEKVRSVESYCIQPSGYCNEEQEKEIYLNGFDDMRAYKIINIIGYAKEKGITLEALKK